MAIWVSSNDLSCRKCNDQLKKVRGCTEDIPVRIIEGIEVRRCPLKYLTNTEIERLQAYKEYQAGFLPNTGGWLEQPMKFTQIITFIAGEVSRLEEDKNG